MNELSVQLLIKPKCKLIAVDNTGVYNQEYIDITDHVSLEFLTLHDSDTIVNNSVVFKSYLHYREEYNNNNTIITINNDG